MSEKTMARDFTPADIDWSAEWAKTYARSSITMRRSDRSSYWEKRAQRFSTMDNGAAGRVRAVLDRIGIDSKTTILDVGCGPGNLAIPLAKAAKHITALDPAKAMLDKLEEHAERENVTNIRCINKGWEEAVQDKDVAPHDIVLSSYSLIMKDVGTALAAMNDMAKQTVCLFWFAGRECFGYDRFWPVLFGKEFIAGPDHTYLINILNSMNIYPEVSIIPQRHVTNYADMDDAVQCWSDNLYLTCPEDRETVREVLCNILCTETDTPVFSRDVRTAMIWWHKE